MSGFAPGDRLAAVRLREARAIHRPPQIQQELDVALFDLAEENRFRLCPRPGAQVPAGPYTLHVGMVERMLVIEVETMPGDGAPDSGADGTDTPEQALGLHLSLSPLRGVIKDYFAICESYFDAVKRLPADKIEAIDMGRRGVHDEGARILADRLDGRVELDHDTCRRLFTVICALQYRG